MKILFSIVSHDQQALVQKLIESFDQYVRPGSHQVSVVVTENKLDGLNIVSKKFPIISNINMRQKGFGDNHNIAFEKLESDYFFIVNPDIILHEEVDLNRIVQYLESQNISIASPKVINTAGKLEDYKRADLSLVNLLMRKIFKKDNEKFEWFAGMFLVVNSKSFRKLKGFNLDYFMYVEDCDLCMRARQANMNLAEIEDLTVIHDARRASRKSFKHFKWHISSLLKYWFLK